MISLISFMNRLPNATETKRCDEILIFIQVSNYMVRYKLNYDFYMFAIHRDVLIYHLHILQMCLDFIS